MRPKLTTLAAGLVAAALAAGTAQAASVVLQPNEADSKDVFVYAFAIPGTLGIPTPPNISNLDTANVPASAAVPFGAFLGAAETEAFTDPADPMQRIRMHTTRSLLQFDLGGVELDPSRVRKATLELSAVPGLPPFNNPTPASPVTLNAKEVLEAWDEQMVTWETRPMVGSIVDSTVQDGAPQKVRFDLTDLVMKWLGNPTSNYGVEISQDAIVAIPQDPGARDRFVAALFASSAGDPSTAPRLTVAAVPLPAPFLLLGGAFAALFGLRRFRRT